MSDATMAMTETVAVIHRVLTRGSSFPCLVETISGRLYVMKLAGTGPGPRALATQYVALMLAHRLGLPAPGATAIYLPAGFPWQVGTDEFYEATQRSAGLNLGIVFLPDASDVLAEDLQSLPVGFLSALSTVDALLQNVDRTLANPNVMCDRSGNPWAIDFGACLLLERLARGALEPRLDLPANHFLAHDARLPRPARQLAHVLDELQLGTILDVLPDAWLADLSLTREVLAHRLETYFHGVREVARAVEPM